MASLNNSINQLSAPEEAKNSSSPILIDSAHQPKQGENTLSESIKLRFTQFEIDQKLKETIDMKIEKVVLSLGISRSSVHFIENYKYQEEESDLKIDYKAMRLLHESLQQCEQFVTTHLKEN